MGWHFGHNCAHYLPTLGKCRVLIDEYRKRADLVAKKPLSARDILIYLNLPPEEIARQVATGEIKAERQKTGKIVFHVSTAWQWDDCPLANGGGQCLYFKPHDGQKITRLMDLGKVQHDHPNLKNLPSEENVRTLERKTIEATSSSQNS